VLSPLSKSLRTWQFTFPGPPSTPYSRGLYTGRIHLPPSYPLHPPSVYMLTRSGRWRCREKICLSASDYHPETWDVRWNIHRLILGLRVHMASDLEGEIGSIQVSEVERRVEAERSRRWRWDDGKGNGVDHLEMLRNGVFGRDAEEFAGAEKGGGGG
ncbi:hypothetical protein TrRE_jg306, partial [Triparma retinervis]